MIAYLILDAQALSISMFDLKDILAYLSYSQGWEEVDNQDIEKLDNSNDRGILNSYLRIDTSILASVYKMSKYLGNAGPKD